MKKKPLKKAPAKRVSKSEPKERAVIVTTAHRGVFFGFATKTDGETIKLRAGQLAIYWAPDCKGFMGLASHGPTAKCRIGRPANIELRNVTAVLEVESEEAIKAWSAAPWC